VPQSSFALWILADCSKESRFIVWRSARLSGADERSLRVNLRPHHYVDGYLRMVWQRSWRTGGSEPAGPAFDALLATANASLAVKPAAATHVLLAEMLESRGEFEGALPHWQAAVDLSSWDVPPARSSSDDELGRAALLSRHASSLELTGHGSLARARYREAELAWTRFLTLEDTSGQSMGHWQRGVARAKLSRRGQARQDFAAAIAQHDPRVAAELVTYLAVHAREAADLDLARAAYETTGLARSSERFKALIRITALAQRLRLESNTRAEITRLVASLPPLPQGHAQATSLMLKADWQSSMLRAAMGQIRWSELLPLCADDAAREAVIHFHDGLDVWARGSDRALDRAREDFERVVRLGVRSAPEFTAARYALQVIGTAQADGAASQ
jgi:tetratricopeptide (TPR) repeat protein